MTPCVQFQRWTSHVCENLWQDTFSPVSGESPESLSERQRGHHCSKPSPDPSCPALHQTFFLPTGCTIRSLLSGLGSGGCVGSKKWALSHWIMPLFQLLWPGMPNFTARYSSLCVNQSFARGRGAHWVRLQQRVSPLPHLIHQLISHKLHDTCSFCIFFPKRWYFSNMYNYFVLLFVYFHCSLHKVCS